MATALLFPSLPSTTATSSPHKNPKPSSSPLRSLAPLFISVSRARHAFTLPRRPAAASATPLAFRYDVPVETDGPDASSTGGLLDISQLGISQQIVSALSQRGITQLFPIQRAVLEPAMEGRDMIGRAITGSGKTLAFGIPILDKIIRHHSQHRKKQVPSALILAPTRELARQVQREFKESAPNLSSTCLYGGVPIINQVRMLGLGIDIAVGTPGRIIDLVERGALNLSEVKFVVLDEADQMLAIGFQEDVECILSYLPAKKQCMLFSATMPSWVHELSRKYLRNPIVIDLVGESDQKLAEGISLYSISSTTYGKENLLPMLISRYAHGGKSLIFTKTRKDAEELSRSMRSIIGSKPLHGNMQQLQRDKTLAAFCDGRFNVLVATDVAARGLDIPNVDLVIHFEMPNTSETFVHRSGRTGRAGKKGNAVLIFTEGQRRAVRFIEQDVGCKFEELPRSSDGVASRKVSMDGRGSFYGAYDGPEIRQDHSLDRRFGNYGRSQRQNYDNGKNKVLYSNASKFSGEGTNGGYGRSRKNGLSRISRPGQTPQSRRTQALEYGDIEVNNFSERSTILPDTNRFRRSPRSTTPRKHETGNDSDSYFHRDTNIRKGKRQSTASGSSPEDFEQILDLFRNLK